MYVLRTICTMHIIYFAVQHHCLVFRMSMIQLLFVVGIVYSYIYK